MNNTTLIDVINSFHSHPLAKQALPSGLENQFFLNALGEYELDIGGLNYNSETEEFDTCLSNTKIYTLGMIMYTQYLTRELSRIEKLNGFSGKDLSMTGIPASKTITKEDLEIELSRVAILLHKQKPSAYN